MPTLVEPETSRLRLRQWQPADREPFSRLNADPRVMACFPASLDRAASDALAERCAALISERGWGFWAVDLKKTGKFIGFVGLHVPSAELPFASCVEIGWRLAHEYWGQGLASEAVRAALQVGFTTLALPEIVAFTARSNLRSQAVMARIGMRDAGRAGRTSTMRTCFVSPAARALVRIVCGSGRRHQARLVMKMAQQAAPFSCFSRRRPPGAGFSA